MQVSFNVHLNGKTEQIDNARIMEYAREIGLDSIAPGRFSALFALNILLLELVHGIPPDSVLAEVRALEGAGPATTTKPESEFRGAYLRGLWHKHFFFANLSVLATNIMNQLAGGRLDALVNQVFDPSKSPTITAEMVGELSHRVVHESLENRSAQNRLTGEWIIFAKHEGQNYYLCTSTHESGDENIAQNIKTACLPEFGFLSAYLS